MKYLRKFLYVSGAISTLPILLIIAFASQSCECEDQVRNINLDIWWKCTMPTYRPPSVSKWHYKKRWSNTEHTIIVDLDPAPNLGSPYRSYPNGCRCGEGVMHIRYWQPCAQDETIIRGYWMSDMVVKPPHGDKLDVFVKLYIDELFFTPSLCN